MGVYGDLLLKRSLHFTIFLNGCLFFVIAFASKILVIYMSLKELKTAKDFAKKYDFP